MKEIVKSLPKDLKSLVNQSVSLLGEVIKEEEGQELFKTVEKIRKLMIEYRSAPKVKKSAILNKANRLISHQSSQNKHKIAHSYTLMLELINACEAAYRTYRLISREKGRQRERTDNILTYVLTAHPTEARTPQNIELFRRIQNIALKVLNKTGEAHYMNSLIKHNLKLLWLLPITRHDKPTVKDEADHLFSIILRPDILNTILRSDRDIGNVRIRTWVGGDKDGHPGVDEKVMVECLQASRHYFYRFLIQVFGLMKEDLSLLEDLRLTKKVTLLVDQLKTIKKIGKDDSSRIQQIKKAIQNVSRDYISVIGDESPRLKKIEAVFKLFPALVVPIELREDSEIVAASLSDSSTAIYRMLKKLSEISDPSHITDYAQGFILSMCHSYADIKNGIELTKRIFGTVQIPVIPLFETALALEKSDSILDELFKNKAYMKTIKQNFSGRLEVMLGYSDSSKGMGVLASRVAIAQTIRKLDVKISEKGFTPVFFHGSGGSIDRGGGSLSDQTAWWPKSALHHYKATIQGEMVERNFTSAEVTMSGIDKVLENYQKSKSKQGQMKIDRVVDDFSLRVKQFYTDKIGQDEFFRLIEAATPYTYLSALKLGSRPAKRAKAQKLDLNSIRAIPWILCWTQIRILFPTWWGIGSAWSEIKKDETYVKKLQKSFQTSALFSSYIRSLGFTLSKVELGIFNFYLDQSDLDDSIREKYKQEFAKEYQQAVAFLKSVTGQKDLLWYRPWLADSIRLRAPMIHPLNLLQVDAFKSKDLDLLRKTVAGISSGMMTTG